MKANSPCSRVRRNRADNTLLPRQRKNRLQLRAAFFPGSPDRVDLDHVLLLIVAVVHVAARLFHQHALDELAPRSAVTLANFGHRADSTERRRKFFDEELLRIAIRPPPGVFLFKSSLRFLKQDDLHGGLDTA